MPSLRRRVCSGCVHGSPPVFPECSADPLWGLNRRLLCGAVLVVRSLIAAFSDAWAPWQFGRVVLRLPGSMQGTDPATVTRPLSSSCLAVWRLPVTLTDCPSSLAPGHRFMVAMCVPVR